MEEDGIVTVDVENPVWPHVFTVAPLVLIGTREENGHYNLAPKHMAMPLGWDNYWGFLCSATHSTYQNIERERVFTVTYPRPNQVLFSSLAASPRTEDDVKPGLAMLPTFPARQVDGIFLEDGYFFLECELQRTVEGFGENSLVAGRVVAAYAAQSALRTDERDPGELIREEPLLVFLNWGRFATIRDSYAFPLPSGFKR